MQQWVQKTKLRGQLIDYLLVNKVKLIEKRMHFSTGVEPYKYLH